MNNEEIIRQEAVRLFLAGHTVQQISGQMLRTRQWVYKWIGRYQKDPQGKWYECESTKPRKQPEKTSESIEKSVIEIRKELLSNPYHQTGAINVSYRLLSLGIQPPSVATINRIIRKHGLQNPKSSKSKKDTEYPQCFLNVQQMDIIGPRYLKGGFKFYFYTIIDVQTHYASLYPIKNKSALSIAPCLIDFWTNFQLPDYLQMDNALTFRGSNKHPRSLGLLMKITLSNHVRPVFIPPAEPWRNGIIEKFNDTVHKKFYSVQSFSSFENLCEKAVQFNAFHNQNHRYASGEYRTPNQLIEPLEKRIRIEKIIDFRAKISIEEGSLIFVRFIRSDLKLKILDAEFILDPELKYSYVTAWIIIEKYVLVVYRDTTLYHVFPFAMSLPK